jgi:hypothetical protein
MSDQAANVTVDARLRHFACLDRTQQEQAIRRLAAVGHGDHTIAAATRWSVEAVRHVIGERR